MRVAGLILILFMLLIAKPAGAETPGGMARDAQRAFEAGRYQEAIHKWEELTDLGYVNGNIYFNMANAYWRLGQPGQTYRYLIMAKKLEPRDGDIRTNLSFVQEKLGKAQKIPEGPIGLIRRVPWWHLSLNYYEAFYFLGIASFLFFGYLFWSQIKKRRPSLKALIPLGLIFGLALVFWMVRGAGHFFRAKAIIVGAQVPLLTAPSSEALSGLQLPEGATVKIEKKQGNFRLVKTNEGKEGWVEAKGIGEIR
ncbi:MAG: tetratricopeptide repeat protein [bacterium]|nr:tetratricopeptide repeat protein [bacterium]